MLKKWICLSCRTASISRVFNIGDVGLGVGKLLTSNIHIGCLFYKVTHIPCPACGSTHSALALLNGDFSGAFYDNPFGFVLVLLMILLPVWIGFDFFSKKESFACAYQKMETLFKKKSVAIPGVLLVLGNWIWNIYKYL